MVQGYYTLEEASRILDMSQEKLSQMAQRREVRAFADRGTWRFRTQDIDEMARRMGRGSNPELQLGEASKVTRSPSPTPRRPGDSPPQKKAGDEGIFNFQVSSGESSAKSQDIIVDSPSSRKLGGKSSGRISPSPKPGSDSDVKLVPDGSDVDFKIAPDSDVRLEQPPRPGGKPSSSKRVRPEDPKSSSRRKTGMPGADAGVRLIPMEGPGAPAQPPKTPADSDIRFEEYRGPSPSSHQRDHSATEEIDLDAELRQAEEMAKRARAKQKPKTGMPQTPTTSSDFEISPAESQVQDDRTAEFSIPPSDEEVELGELPPRDLTTAGGDSGINLGSPADSGIDLEKVGDSHAEKVEFELGLEDVPGSPAGTQQPDVKEGAEEEDSSSEFELSLDVEGTPPPANAKDDSSSEFELSLDVEGTPPPAKAEDSSSEFELTLDGTEGLAPVEEGSASSSAELEAEKDIFETDFEVPAMSEGAASDAADLEEHDTALESSDFDLSLVGESASQVVDLGEQSADESSDTISRSVVLDEDAVDDVDELLEDDLGGMRPPLEEEEEEEELVAAPVAAAPASWGAVPAIFLIPCVLLMFLISLMSFEMLHSLIGYEPAAQPSGALVKWVARAFGEKISD